MLFLDKDRKCTDLFCFIILVVFVLIMFIFGIYSWTSGNFKKLTTPYDSDGKGCGLDYPDYPYIYFASPHIDVTLSIKISPCGSQPASKHAQKKGTPSLTAKQTHLWRHAAPQTTPTTQKQCKFTILQMVTSFSISVRGVICMPTSDKIKT